MFLLWEQGTGNVTDKCMERVKILSPGGTQFVPSPGPDGYGCLYSSVRLPASQLLYSETEQHWEQYQGLWYGYDKTIPPQPVDYLRKNIGLHCSDTVTINGVEWLVPIVRNKQTGDTALPRTVRYKLNDDHSMETVVSINEKYIPIWELYKRVEKSIIQIALEQNPETDWHIYAIEFVWKLLAINYQVDYKMVELMRAYDDQGIGDLFHAAGGNFSEFPFVGTEDN